MVTTDVELLEDLERFVIDEGWCHAVRHPLVNLLPYKESMNATLNDEFVKKSKALEQAKQDRNWSFALQLHEKPWRMDALVEMASYFTDEEYWHNLGQVWMEVEQLRAHGDEVFKLFEPSGRDVGKRRLLMTDDECTELDSLPSAVTIYRGCGPANESGWSWTLSEDTAEWFSGRFEGGNDGRYSGLVLVGKCQRSSVIAYFARRDEDEIVIAPRNVETVDRIKLSDDDKESRCRLLYDASENIEMRSKSASDANAGRVSADQIRRFEPKPDWFIRTPEGIHGLGHETRVLIWSQILVSMVRDEDLEVDGEVVGWAAAVHDTQRWNDGIDAGHGARAADWILERPRLIPAPVPLDQIAYVCRWHVPPDERAPDMTPELKVFKDADALDRWRIDDLDPAYLRTKSARQLLDASHDLWEATHGFIHATEMFEQIIDVARAQGLVVDA